MTRHHLDTRVDVVMVTLRIILACVSVSVDVKPSFTAKAKAKRNSYLRSKQIITLLNYVIWRLQQFFFKSFIYIYKYIYIYIYIYVYILAINFKTNF